MSKPLLIGGGVLLLGLLGATWFVVPALKVNTPPVSTGVLQKKWMPESTSREAVPAKTPTSSWSKEDRRKRLAQLRTEMSSVLAQGNRASPTQALALLSELEPLSQGEIDPRYFQTLRRILEYSMAIETLNMELKRLSTSTAPQDITRAQAVLAEIGAISQRINYEAMLLKTYTPVPSVGKKIP